jgi:PAS domain S-box-containing protein
MREDSVRSIVLVEDEAIIALAEKRALEAYGYRVRVAYSGRAAIEALGSGEPVDLVLIDIDLGPGMDGTETAAAILGSRDVPVVFLSSHTEPEVVARTERITSYGYVVKNSSVTVLDASIKMAFKLFEANKATRELKDKLMATLEALPDFLAEVGPDGLVYDVHAPSRGPGSGLAAERIGERLTDRQTPDVALAIASALREASERGASFGRLYSKEGPGGARWFELSISAKAGADADRRFVVLRRDVTERQRALELIKSRIVALTQPLEEGSIEFGDLFDGGQIQRLQDEFAAATGVASIITTPEGAPITAPSNFTRFCMDIVRKTDTGCANCFRSDALLGRYHPDGPVVSECLSGGLWDAGANIVVGGRHIANWLIGQVRDETQTEEGVRTYAREIGAEEATLLEAFADVPVMSRSRFEAIAEALYSIAKQIADAAYQNVQQARAIARIERTEAELLRQKNLLSAIIESSSVSIFAKDRDGRYEIINASGARYLGREASRIVGMRDVDLLPEPVALEFRRTDERVMETGTAVETMETGLIDGVKRTFLVNKAPWRDGAGAVIGITGISNEVTEQAIEVERLRALLRAKDELLEDYSRRLGIGFPSTPPAPAPR